MLSSPSTNAPDRPHVLIAGGGVAGLEAPLALRALAGGRIDIAIVAPDLNNGDGIPVEVELDPVEPDLWQVLADLSVIGPG